MRTTEVATEAPAPHGAACRSLYSQVTNPEQFFPDDGSCDAIRGELRGLLPADAARHDLAELRSEVACWASSERHEYLRLPCGEGETAEAMARRVALACAPLAVRAGAWLQWLSAPGNGDRPHTLRVLGLYAADVGVGHPRASRGDAYVAWLRGARVSEYAEPASRLSLDRRIADRHFYLPALLLAMSRRPGDFEPEILGADLCLRTIGELPPLALARAVLPHGPEPAGRTDGPGPRPSQAPGAQPGPRPADDEPGWLTVREYLRTDPGAARRVLDGFGWAWGALRRWSGDLRAELRAVDDPAHEMAELLRSRAREGAVYHDRVVLGGRPLSQWLRECRQDASAFLAVLAASDLVRPGDSDRSRLVNGLVLQRGPMFRIFAPEDLRVIRRWIDGLPADRSVPDPGRVAAPIDTYPVPALFGARPTRPGSPASPAATAAASLTDTSGPADLRAAYRALQNRTDTPGLRWFAQDHVRGRLERARRADGRDPGGLPRRWTPEGIRPWLLDQHDRHHADFEMSSRDPLPSKERLIESTIQLAPLTLIDGAWLQGFTDYGLASSEHGHFLFQTYWDELGNGAASLNHPLIYREGLAEMGVHLPPTASEEFARWPGFEDSSFELPVHWLGIGRYPRTFTPEILGLNLAMELSGVGGGYRRAHLALREYGFSTRFVDIHNTIDNVATGHSAWAADAIDAYLSSVPGAQEQQAAWDRVRAGFRSLDLPAEARGPGRPTGARRLGSVLQSKLPGRGRRHGGAGT
ncbi:hypothetical protein GCM10009639_35350 [Kitasatospora putterlickiae]|uniref:Iron-containing redox enzyme family protein n=1 Tax=Kitasatospora putterlickiae TaxID=221725 RepID=A0ABN1Y4I7_9ACTN